MTAIAVLAIVGVAAWIRPMAAITFVVVGATPYYAILHALDLETSAALTGSLFASAGTIAVLRFALNNGFRIDRRRRKYFVLFMLFVALWYVRWFQFPPSQSLDERTNEFSDRALFFMAVFGILPFLAGLFALRTRTDVEDALRWLSFWGALALTIVLDYWVTGQISQSAQVSEERWDPIPSLTGIILSFDIGTGCLAFLLATDALRSPVVALVRWVFVAGVIAVNVRVGERGPFGFFVIAVAFYFATRTGTIRVRTLLVGAAGIALMLLIAIQVSNVYGSSRALGESEEASQSNEARAEILGAAAQVIGEQPIFGWGGGLQGRFIGDQEWFYVHVSLLDPLIETGVVGALLVWTIYGLLIRRVFRLFRTERAVRFLTPLLLYTALESQVSGHVSMTKHFWFVTGLMCSIVELVSEKTLDEPAPSVSETGAARGAFTPSA